MEGYIPTIYEKYEQISAQPDEEEEIANIMPHFLFYRRIKNDVDYYCTACHNRYFRPKSDFVGGSAALSHKEQGLCPVCGEAVQFRCMSYGRRTLDRWENFVLVRPEREDHVFLECCGVRLHFEDDDMEPKYDLFLKASYELSPGSVARYVWRWHWYGGYDWAEAKSIREPRFINLLYGWGDNTYTVIGEDKLDGTFLKYAMTADVPSEWLFVTYLCKYAVHPNIEYLMKGGFVDIVTELCKDRSGIRVNWKSNDLKKMLRLNRTELNLLKELSAGDYRSYITIRKHLPGVCTEKVINYWQTFKDAVYSLENISKTSGLCWKEIMDYTRRQNSRSVTNRTFLSDYHDYLLECRKLKYDMKSPAVLFPHDMYAAHERTSKAIVFQKNKELEKKMRKADEQRSWLAYADEKRGLCVILPKSVDDIIREGRIQDHCVAGYADRHAEGQLHIVFLRRLARPDKPFYTMEITTEGRIKQCRGYRNNVVSRGGNPKPQYIKDFENEYQQYIRYMMQEMKKKKHKKVRKTA